MKLLPMENKLNIDGFFSKKLFIHLDHKFRFMARVKKYEKLINWVVTTATVLATVWNLFHCAPLSNFNF